jgi:phage terminase large subunit-like protein
MATRTTRSPRRPKPAALDALKISPEVWWYLVSRGIPLPEKHQVPLWKTPEPRDLPGAQFDPERVDKVIRAMSRLRHTQGRWAGKPLKPDPWQVAYFIAPVFGWVRFDEDADRWVRIIRTAMLDIPRKNGKTTIAGGIALYLTGADGEPGAQVLAVAASERQAGYCFQPVKSLVDNSPGLRHRFKTYVKKIVHHATQSYFAVVASMGDLLHGANVHGAVIDELHVHKTRDVVDAVETGTGARDQPLIVIITTASDGKPNTIYAEKRKILEQLARGALVNPAWYGVVFAAAESEKDLAERGLDPFAESTMKLANPGYGVSPTRAFMQQEAETAKASPANLARYLRLHLGIRTKQTTRYIKLEDWDLIKDLVDEEALVGRQCHGGLDMASVSDVTALCWVFPDREADTYTALWRFWIPSGAREDLARRTAGSSEAWIRDGWLTVTDGATLDTSAVFKTLDEDAQKFSVLTCGFDRWGANDVTRKAANAGMTMVGVGQGYASMNAPMREMLRLTKVKRLIHGGNPVVRWMIDNLAVAQDPSGNTKPDKATAGEKIDGVSALATALAECIDAELPEAQPEVGASHVPPPTPGDLFRPTKRLKI